MTCTNPERGIVRVKCLAQEYNTMAQPGLEPRLPDPESSTLSMRSPCLPQYASSHNPDSTSLVWDESDGKTLDNSSVENFSNRGKQT